MPTPKKKNYLNNKDLIAEVIASKEEGRMSDKLARMLQMLAQRFARKPNYIGYTFNEDMQAYAMMHLCKTWSRFDEKKFSNAFAYYTQCVYNSFSQYLNKEKTQREVRDKLILQGGLSPSFTYTENHKDDVYDGKAQQITHR